MSQGDDIPSEDRRIRHERRSYRDAPYRREFGGSFRRLGVCKNCKQPGHFARECSNVATCNNCGLPGHLAAECTGELVCWNCKKPGHNSRDCRNEAICHTCGKAGHLARDCTVQPSPGGDARLCNNCHKQGHVAAECTNEKACNKCRQAGHLARDCRNEPVCYICNISGHLARACPKVEARSGGERGGNDSEYWFGGSTSYDRLGGLSRGYMATMPTVLCQTCGGWGHFSFECPTGRFIVGGHRRYKDEYKARNDSPRGRSWSARTA